MARFILALLAALALAVGPVSASARTAICGMDAGQAVASSMAMGGAADSTGGSDPCCDKAALGCSKSCPTICAASVACLTATPSVAVLDADMAFSLPEGAVLRPHEPLGPDHPPKTMA